MCSESETCLGREEDSIRSACACVEQRMAYGVSGVKWAAAMLGCRESKGGVGCRAVSIGVERVQATGARQTVRRMWNGGEAAAVSLGWRARGVALREAVSCEVAMDC